MSPLGRFCCKSLFALAIKISFGCAGDFHVNMWGTSLSEEKLAGDHGNVIEATSIGGRRSDFLTAGKLAPGNFGLLQQYLPIAINMQQITPYSITSSARREAWVAGQERTADMCDPWRHFRFVPILLQKSAISTAKRLTRFFEAHVAVCSIGSQL